LHEPLTPSEARKRIMDWVRNVKRKADPGNVSSLVSEKGKGYLIGDFAKTLIKEVPQCRNQLRQSPM
jgi:hypothetical protein